MIVVWLIVSIGGGGSVSVVTDYPYDDVVTVIVLANSAMPVYLRIPVWATNATVYANEQLQEQPANGTMYQVSRLSFMSVFSCVDTNTICR